MPHTKAAFDLMDSLTPAWADLQPRSMLYVGWRHDCHPWWYKSFAPALGINELTILEVHGPNVSDAEQRDWQGQFGLKTRVIQGNVLNPARYYRRHSYDIIFWDHGPEHVTKAELEGITPFLKEFRNKLLIYCCPWGHWPQEPTDGNEHERHSWDVQVKDMEDVGMLKVFTVGKPGQDNGGEIVATW